MKASLMVTCLGDFFFPECGVATVNLLRRLGVEVDFPGGWRTSEPDSKAG